MILIHRINSFIRIRKQKLNMRENEDTYKNVLQSLGRGDIVTFNDSGGSNAKSTAELEVVIPGEAIHFEGPNNAYIVDERNGELELLYGDKDEEPTRLYDTIETIELIDQS